MRSEVQVLLDPPRPAVLPGRSRVPGQGDGALAQLVERLLCKQDVIGSNPLGSTITPDMIRQPLSLGLSRPVGRASFWKRLTSFREKIGVVGRSRVWGRWERSSDRDQR